MSVVNVVDPCTDLNAAELFKLDQIYQLPSFVKQAFRDTQRPDMPRVLYADPDNRRYPCHTAAATYLSQIYFNEKSAEFSPEIRQKIATALKAACDFFSVSPPTTRPQEKVASPSEDDYAFVWKPDDASDRVLKLPIRTPAEVKQAADWIDKYRDGFPLFERAAMCRRILQKAAKENVELSAEQKSSLQKQAGFGISDVAAFRREFQSRRYLSKSAELTERLNQIEQAATTPKTLGSEKARIKLACALDLLDRELRLKPEHGLKTAEDLFCGIPYQEIASLRDDAFSLQTGAIYSKQAMTRLDKTAITHVFGDELLREVTTGLQLDPEKAASVFSTLPLSEAETLELLLSEAGVQPLSQKQAGIAPERLEAVAAGYVPGI